MDEPADRQRPAITVLDVIALSPIETYAVLATIALDQDPAVIQALAGAVSRILSRTRNVNTLT